LQVGAGRLIFDANQTPGKRSRLIETVDLPPEVAEEASSFLYHRSRKADTATIISGFSPKLSAT
jgi:hypothetical protein